MIRVRNFMTTEVMTVSEDIAIIEVAKKMASKSVSGFIVVEENKPIGVINEKDIVRAIMLRKAKVKDVMTADFAVISPNYSLHKVTKMLNKTNIKRFPVVENEKLIGLITETDIIEATRDLTKYHQMMLEVILAIFGVATAFFLFYFSPYGRSLFG
ncbi:MAG: CBS domain-containing protein [Nanoarchaeota archaeon]